MTALLVQVQVSALRLGTALRQYWRRVVVGAFFGWLASSIGGAFVLAWLESRGVITTPEASVLLGAALVWSATGLGAILAYAARPERQPAGS